MKIDLGVRRLAGGLLILALAAYIGSGGQTSLRLPVLVGGLSLGWLIMKVLIATGLANPARGGTSVLTASTIVGVAIAAFAGSALSGVGVSRHGVIEIFVNPSEGEQGIYVVSPSDVERWPRNTHGGCA